MVPALIGGGETGQRVRETDWSTTPLGAFSTWPQSLRSALSLVLNTKGIAALYWGAEQWLLYNDAYAAALGDRHPWAWGQPMPQALPDIAPVLGPQVAEVLATGNGFAIENLPLVMRRHGRDEETVWTYGFSPVQGERGEFAGVLLLATEMTEQKAAERGRDEAEAELREAQEALRSLNVRLEQQVEDRTRERDRLWRLSRDLFLISDLQGRWLSVNPAWTTLLGWTEQELLGRTSEWLEHPDDVANTRAEIGRLADGMATLAFENRFRTRGGDYRHLAWTAVPEDDRFYCVARDVTDENRQVEVLRQSQVKAATYFNSSDDYLFLVRVGASGPPCFEDMNPACERIMGLVRTEVIGRPVDVFLPPDSAADINRYTRLCLETGRSQRYHAPRTYREGRPVIIEGRVALVESTGSHEGLVLFSGHDVTEQRGVEEALRQSQKMEAVGQLTGGLAHDFNNLLTGVTGSLELMQTRIAQGRIEDVDRYVNAAQGAAKRAAALTHRLLAFSRRQTLDPRSTDVNRLVRGMEDLIRRTVGPAIEVEPMVGTAGIWPTLVDPGQLENALLNLCINARDAMPDGGKLTIETGNRWLDERTARERDLSPGQYVSLCVSDTGTGMPADVVAKAFDPFFTTKPIGQGTGLGLSMIYGFAKQSGGQVRIYSEVGQGTMVCLYLPRHLGEAEAAELPAELVDAPRAEHGQTVLVVDDEPTVRMLVTEVLEDLGYRRSRRRTARPGCRCCSPTCGSTCL